MHLLILLEPETHPEVTIFFSDICGFTNMSATLDPLQVSEMLDRLCNFLFSPTALMDIDTAFDKLCDYHELYKIETIGVSPVSSFNYLIP